MNIWRALGLEEAVLEAKVMDRSGPQVLEQLLKLPTYALPGYDSIKAENVTAIVAWYIWWMWRKIAHGEEIPPIMHVLCKFN
jgi:hypothetical protein